MSNKCGLRAIFDLYIIGEFSFVFAVDKDSYRILLPRSRLLRQVLSVSTDPGRSFSVVTFSHEAQERTGSRSSKGKVYEFCSHF